MPSSPPLVIALMGPTASGKTELALEIAEQLDLTIHSVDSRQLYIGMDIGTAKPNEEQQNRVKHHLIDLRQPDEPMTLQEFQKEAQLSLNKALTIKRIALLVGGSGLYLKAITAGLQPPAVPPQPHLREQFTSLGQETSYQLLKAADPLAAEKISQSDSVRTQRALEVIYATGNSISSQQTSKAPPWKVLELGLDPPDLKDRIIKRTQKLFQNGLLEETTYLSERFGPDLPMLQTIGYKEALEVIQGKSELNEAINKTTTRTQQFAKRQRTWFKGKHHPQWLKDEEPLREALSIIKAGLG